MKNIHQYEVVIIGGSYAGLSAAMALGRSMRKTLIIDSGKPCNRFTPSAHNFITHDGKLPAAITADAKKQVLKYATVSFMEDIAVSGEKTTDGFEIITASAKNITAKKIIFATGVTDEMPDIKGFAGCWGKSVLHCPYCHGYEIRQTKLGVMANGDIAYEFAKLIEHWSRQLILFTNGPSLLSAAQTEKLQLHAIDIIETPVEEFVHRDGYIEHILLKDGNNIPINAIFAKIGFSHSCSIPAELGCAFTEQGYIQVDDFQRTTIPGIYAAGDNTNMFRALSAAVAAGSKAGAVLNKELVDQHF